MEPTQQPILPPTQADIIAWRKANSVTQAKLAQLLGLPSSMVSQYEAADRLYDFPRMLCLHSMGIVSTAHFRALVNDKLLGIFAPNPDRPCPVKRSEAIANLKAALEAL